MSVVKRKRGVRFLSCYLHYPQILDTVQSFDGLISLFKFVVYYETCYMLTISKSNYTQKIHLPAHFLNL